jgi:integrase
MRGKITKRAVDTLVVDAKSELTLWDTEVRGFGLRVRVGGARTYIVRYRAGAGGRCAPLRTLTIGRHGSPWTPDSARGEAKRLLGLVEGGTDPAADLSARRKAPTVQELAERFLLDHVSTRLKGGTGREYRMLVQRFVIPALGRKKVVDVTRHDVVRLHQALKETPYQANRLLAVLSKMFNLAESWGLRPDASNPCRRVEKFKEKARERLLSGEELGRLGDALRCSQEAPQAIAAIKLLIFTGARLSEILGLRWSWVDFERGEARLPDSKTGAKTVHLPPPALAVLANLPVLSGNPFVIPGLKQGSPWVDLEKPWRRVRQAAGLEDVRLHDLRHAFASIAVASGMSLPMIGKLLGHTQTSTTARYAHLANDPVKAAAASVAARIDGALSGRSASVARLLEREDIGVQGGALDRAAS